MLFRTERFLANKQYRTQVRRKKIPGVNFINVFTLSFYIRRSQKWKKLLELTVFLALLGSAQVKAARKHVDEIGP